MAHEIAKLILEHADTIAERSKAVRIALWMGMPPEEVEQYLDALDQIRGEPTGRKTHPSPQSPGEGPGKPAEEGPTERQPGSEPSQDFS